MLRVELEEMEIKNHDLLDKNSDLDDKIEELYRETHYLEQLNQEINNLKSENRGVKADCERMDVAKEHLELKLAHSEKEISKLNSFLRERESATTLSCQTCEDTANTEKDPLIHALVHTEESMPSTSMCGKCSYESDDEKHQHEEHRFDCDHCDFISQSEETFNVHMEEFHPYKCKNCNLAHSDKWKHTIHICREEIDNPTHNSLYTKAWLNKNGCNGIYCSERNEDVVWLHNHKCWSGELCCSWTPHVYFGNPVVPGEVRHLEYSKFVKDKKICWSDLCLELES